MLFINSQSVPFMVSPSLAGVRAQFPRRKFTLEVHCCVWREVFCSCFNVDFCLHPQAVILLKSPPNAPGKGTAKDHSICSQETLSQASVKKGCFPSSSGRMTVDVTHGTFKLEDWISWGKQTFGESLSSLKLENILGLDKTRGNNPSSMPNISTTEKMC